MPAVTHDHNTHKKGLFDFIPGHYIDTIVIASVAFLTFYLLLD